jgi:hypothetical protein
MKKNLAMLLVGVLCGLGGLTGCGLNSEGAIDIPDVDMSCTTARCQINSSPNGRDAVSVITTEGCAPDQIDSNSIASGTTTVSCTVSNGCTGSVTSWRDKNGVPIAQITASTYYVCNWIDLNNNGVKNEGVDEFSELREAIYSASNIEANSPTWGVTYASRGVDYE